MILFKFQVRTNSLAYLFNIESSTESSEVLDIILHTIYNMSCTHMSPAFQSILTAARSLPHYGFASHTFISPTKPLFNLITSYAPLQPLDVYCLAASQDLYELAETTSSYLLSVQLSMVGLYPFYRDATKL